MRPVLISKQSQREIDAAADWYETRREGLGMEFADRVQDAIESIQINPEGFGEVYGEARRAQLRQFEDWALWFQIRPDNLLVIACLSARRRPELAKERALGNTDIEIADP